MKGFLVRDLRDGKTYADEFVVVSLGSREALPAETLSSVFHYFETPGVVAGHAVPSISVVRSAPTMDAQGQYCSIGVLPFGPAHQRFAGKVTIDTDEMNSEIHSPCPGVTVYPNSSRRVPGKPGISSGWFTQPHKGTDLSISEATWTALRSSEVEHYHEEMNEYYLVKEGSCDITLNGRIITVSAGQLMVVFPSWKAGAPAPHRISSIHFDRETGRYGHLCFQYPALFSRDRVVTGHNPVAEEMATRFAR